MISIILTQPLASLTCGDVKTLYTGTPCCGGVDPSTPVRPECDIPDEERLCLGLLNTKFDKGTVLTARMVSDSYCHISGTMRFDIPFEMAIPKTAANRLIASSHYGDDIGTAQLDMDQPEIAQVAKYGSIVGKFSSNAYMQSTNVPEGWDWGYGPLDEPGNRLYWSGLTEMEPRRWDMREGGAARAFRQLVKSVSTHMFGKDVDYAYIGGCSGQGKTAVSAAFAYPEGWNGVYASDFYEHTSTTARAAALQPFYDGRLSEASLKKNSDLLHAYCDSPEWGDGEADGFAQWNCDYAVDLYACTSSSRPMFTNYDGTVCFTDEELVGLRRVMQGASVLPDGKPFHGLTASTQHLMRFSPNYVDRTVQSKVEDNWDVFWYGSPGSLSMFTSSDQADALRGMRDIAMEEFAKGDSGDRFKAFFNYTTNGDTLRNMQKMYRQYEIISSPSKTAIQSFINHGHKMLLLVHDGDDFANGYEVGRLLYDNAYRAADNNMTVVDSTLQMYVMGNPSHCGSSGNTLDEASASMLDLVIDWVENGVPPSNISTKSIAAGDWYQDGTGTWKQDKVGTPRSGFACKYPDAERTRDGTRTCVRGTTAYDVAT